MTSRDGELELDDGRMRRKQVTVASRKDEKRKEPVFSQTLVAA